MRVIILSASCFLTNSKGFAVLPRVHQQLLTSFFTRTVQVVLRDAEGAVHTPPPPLGDTDQPMSNGTVLSVDAEGDVATPPPAHSLAVYWNYLSYLFRKQPVLNEEEALEADYRDLLQAPLQPLQDNLESSTYETFERDAAKYNAYEEAVYRCVIMTCYQLRFCCCCFFVLLSYTSRPHCTHHNLNWTCPHCPTRFCGWSTIGQQGVD